MLFSSSRQSLTVSFKYFILHVVISENCFTPINYELLQPFYGSLKFVNYEVLIKTHISKVSW